MKPSMTLVRLMRELIRLTRVTRFSMISAPLVILTLLIKHPFDDVSNTQDGNVDANIDILNCNYSCALKEQQEKRLTSLEKQLQQLNESLSNLLQTCNDIPLEPTQSLHLQHDVKSSLSDSSPAIIDAKFKEPNLSPVDSYKSSHR